MFDPLFALAALLVITALMTVIVFWATRNRLHFRSGVCLAFVVSVAGLIGFWGGMKLNYALSPASFLEETPLMRFGISFVSGIVLSGVLGWLTWRGVSKKR